MLLYVLVHTALLPSCRLPDAASPGMQLCVSHPAPSAGEAMHTAHKGTARHHKHQQAQAVGAGGAPQYAMLPHHADAAGAAPHASSRAADGSRGDARASGAWEGGGYSRGADAAAQSLMRQWQALPGPLEMGGEMPLSR